MGNLLLIRHGSAIAYLSRPRSKFELTTSGRREAASAARLSTAANVSMIVTSPQVRCVQTAEIVAAKIGLVFEVVDALDEAKTSDGTDDADRLHAAVEFLVDLVSEQPNADLLAVTHGNVILATERILFGRVATCAMGVTPGGIVHFKTENGQILPDGMCIPVGQGSAYSVQPGAESLVVGI